MRNVAGKLLLVFMAVSLLAGCSGMKKLRDMQVTSCKIESVTPMGFRAVKGTVAVGIDNPGTRLDLSAINGIIYAEGKELLSFVVEDLSIARKSETVCPVTVTATLAKGTSLFGLKSLLASQLDAYAVDLELRAKVQGAPIQKLHLEKVPVRNILSYFGLIR